MTSVSSAANPPLTSFSLNALRRALPVEIRGYGELSEPVILSAVKGDPHITELSIDDSNHLTASGLETIGQTFQNLRSISLRHLCLYQGKYVNDKYSKPRDVAEFLKKYPNLTVLRFPHDTQDSLVLLVAPLFTTLEKVSLEATKIIGAGLDQLVKANPSLKELDLRYSKISEANLLSTLVFCKKLERLSLSGETVTDRVVRRLEDHGSSLKSLELGFTVASDSALSSLFKKLPQLQEVTIQGCSHPHTGRYLDEVVVSLAESCRDLSKLRLGDSGMSVQGLTALAENCPKLEDVWLDSCYDLLPEDLETFLSQANSLKKLHVSIGLIRNDVPSGAWQAKLEDLKKQYEQKINITFW